MQSYIGCICMACLCCVFWNVISNRLNGKQHNYTGCIDKVSPQCVFSYVTLMTCGKLTSHIGYILTFLHCEFSYVTSMHLSQSMHTDNDYICVIFLRYVFSANVISNCLFGMMQKSHWLHLKGLSPV